MLAALARLCFIARFACSPIPQADHDPRSIDSDETIVVVHAGAELTTVTAPKCYYFSSALLVRVAETGDEIAIISACINDLKKVSESS